MDMSDKWWSPKLGEHGVVVSGYADIDQAIGVILTTPRGSDPMRPLFGSDIHKYIDRPLPWAVPHVIRESWEAVAAWEKRVEVVRVEAEPDAGALVIRVVWRPAGGGAEQVTEVGYGG